MNTTLLIEDVQSGRIAETEEIFVEDLAQRYDVMGDSSAIQAIIEAYRMEGCIVKEKMDYGKEAPKEIGKAISIVTEHVSQSEETFYVKVWEQSNIKRIYINSWRGHTVGYFQSYEGKIWQASQEAYQSEEFSKAIGYLRQEDLNVWVPNISIKIHNEV